MQDKSCTPSSKIPLKRLGNTSDIARAVHFLIQPDQYITGQIIAVDGGRTTIG